MSGKSPRASSPARVQFYVPSQSLAAMQPMELTLIVAATRSMGIGARGMMPWKGLRNEMAYFARVTSRVPPQFPPDVVNVVIMGRKTWDSIPAKFRPLKDRLNIIVTRSAPDVLPALTPSTIASEPVKVASLEHALKFATQLQHSLGRIFVMGGAQIYDAALKLPTAKRVLLTSIKREYECDTFFPLSLEKTPSNSWVKRSTEELKAWTGEGDGVVDFVQEEAGTKYEFQMWEKRG